MNMGLMDKLLSSDTNLIRDAWDRLSPLPGGKRLFSKLIGILAPYTGSVNAQVVDVRRDYAKIELADRRRVRNHLTSVHAIALANLAEMTGNLALAYSLPDDARFIVAGIELEYVKKARGTITAECELEMPRTSERQEVLVPVVMRDRKGDVVTRATLRSLVGPKQK
jgi:acyl-coenzyme A thioesterase PaaI-like protein